MLNQLSDIDYLALLERSPLPTPDPDISQFEGREERLIVAQHRQKLIRLGVNLAAREVEEAIEGYPDNVEGAVIAFLERFQQYNKSATRKLALLIRTGKTLEHPATTNAPRLPVRTSADFALPVRSPTPAPSRGHPRNTGGS